MREQMADETDARVFLGGRIRGYSGGMPGLLEEMLLALDRKQPIFLIGGMGGILQASSRSMMVRHSPADAPTESFGLYGLSGRATSFIAPFLILLVTEMTGNARIGLSPVVALFVVAMIPLIWVKPEGDQIE